MQTTNGNRRVSVIGFIAPAAALLLLSVLAVPAEAQRGGGQGGRDGSGHQGQYGGHSGHRGVHHGGSHGYGRHDGHRGFGQGHRTYRGHKQGYDGYRGRHGYRGHAGHYGAYRDHYGYRYRGHHRPYGSYLYYQSPGYYGFGTYGYPGISISYDAGPRYVRGGSYATHPSKYERYQPRWQAYAVPDAPVDGISESGETPDLHR